MYLNDKYEYVSGVESFVLGSERERETVSGQRRNCMQIIVKDLLVRTEGNLVKQSRVFV